jgi:uncharacterized membrane protein YqaE (UPF0057 family)
VFFFLATFVHFSRASSSQISLLLFCFVVPFGKTYQVIFNCSRAFAKMTDGTKGTYTFIDVLLAILLPPLGVFFKYGFEMEFWLCLLLTILGYIPGIVYAIYVIVR